MSFANAPSSPSALPGKPRDARLDFWRGLCLVDMVLVHLLVQGLQIGHYAHAIFGEYLRFAAGGFIFVAGLGVGRIFLPKAIDLTTRGAAYGSLGRRAVYILAVHYTATLGFLLFAVARGDPLPPIGTLLADVMLLSYGYDLLPFYVVMIALSPLMLELVRRGWAIALAVGSVALFVWGRDHHLIDAIPIQQTFFVVLWQAVFVAGLLAGAALPRYDALRHRAKVAIAGASTFATLALSVMAYGWHFHLPRLEVIWFDKVPLSGGELLRYLAFIVAIITVTDVLWRFIGGSAVERFLARLGRRSLAMYVVHVVAVNLLVPISYRFDVPLFLQLAYFPLAVLMLWCVACAMDALRDRAQRDRAAPANARPFTPWPLASTAIAIVLVLGAWAHHRPLPAGTTDDATVDPQIDADRTAMLDTIGPRFLLPVTPGILRPEDHPDEVAEGTAYAGAARTGRTTEHRATGRAFRRQL